MVQNLLRADSIVKAVQSAKPGFARGADNFSVLPVVRTAVKKISRRFGRLRLSVQTISHVSNPARVGRANLFILSGRTFMFWRVTKSFSSFVSLPIAPSIFGQSSCCRSTLIHKCFGRLLFSLAVLFSLVVIAEGQFNSGTPSFSAYDANQ